MCECYPTQDIDDLRSVFNRTNHCLNVAIDLLAAEPASVQHLCELFPDEDSDILRNAYRQAFIENPNSNAALEIVTEIFLPFDGNSNKS